MDYISIVILAIVLDQLREATKMLKVGETFEQDGKFYSIEPRSKYELDNFDGCPSCVFNNHSWNCISAPPCHAGTFEQEYGVVFVEVKK